MRQQLHYALTDDEKWQMRERQTGCCYSSAKAEAISLGFFIPAFSEIFR
jgi:hypothetical protein